ncbi:MAG: acyl--CoA ligase [Lachnospiraceae bacterium]|nr:acyl--CoA ligase [Lachnospiraceae bacterium]
MRKFTSFSEIHSSWKDNTGNALIFDQDGVSSSMSYPELFEAVRTAAEKLRTAPGAQSCDPVRADHTPETVIRIFADVISGRDVLLADAEVSEEILESSGRRIDASPGDGQEGRLFFFTSGTTSRSRLVTLTSRSLSCSAWSGQCMLPCGPEDTILSVLPLSHVFGFVCSMLWGLCYGASIALGRGVRFLMEDCMYFDPTILPAVPTIVEALHRFHLLNPSLKTVLIGAAPCSEELTRALQREGMKVYLGYGLTETSSGIAITQDQDDPYGLVPCPGADIRIEEGGEISVATPCLMEGYLGEDGAVTDGRFFTGDLGHIDPDGKLRLEGRKKDILVLSDGTKVFCPEYESELMTVIGTKEIAVAQKAGRPVLVVSGDVDRSYVQEAVDHFNQLRQRSRQLADIIYIQEPLPRTAVGKLRRWELQQMLNRS